MGTLASAPWPLTPDLLVQRAPQVPSHTFPRLPQGTEDTVGPDAEWASVKSTLLQPRPGPSDVIAGTAEMLSVMGPQGSVSFKQVLRSLDGLVLCCSFSPGVSSASWADPRSLVTIILTLTEAGIDENSHLAMGIQQVSIGPGLETVFQLLGASLGEKVRHWRTVSLRTLSWF